MAINLLDKEAVVTDEMVDALLDNDRLAHITQRADDKRRALSNREWHTLRVRAKRDLFFLAYGILGYTRLAQNLHGHLCAHVAATEEYRFREYLLPRFHFKSTILTISHSIQIALPYTEADAKYDLNDAPLPWPFELGPDARILIGHETAEGAARFLYAITDHVTGNETLQMLFPEIVPSKRTHRINKWELELPRSKVFPEPTFDTMGVGAKSQGRHYNHIKLDDIYGDKARDSEAEDTATKLWVDNIQAFFDTFARDKLDFIGTRYKFDDLYGHVEEAYGDQLVIYRRAVVEENEFGVKVPIFPEEITEKNLEILKKNPRIYRAQMLNDPAADDVGFNSEWKRYFFWIDKRRIAVFHGTHREILDTRDFDICILIDPGLGKTGGFAVTGMDHRAKVFVLQAIPLGLSHPALVELIFNTVAKWQPRVVAIESDFFASVYEHWLQAEMPRRGIYFHVESVKTKERLKDERILGLSTYMASEQFYINQQQTELDREIDQFGKTKNIHILDALGYGPEVWRPGFAPGTRSAVHDQDVAVNADIDPETGYSVI